MSFSAAGPTMQPGSGSPNASWSHWPAPAKLNLFLRVTGRRPDGYHNLQTAFRLLDWGDSIRLRVRSDGKILSHGPWAAAHDEAQELTMRAAKLLAKESNCKLGADIFVEKHIPLGAGLGGGSTDAATAMLALNQLWGTNLSVDHLAALGLQLGSDVPLFVRGHNAWAEGVGEQLTRIELPSAWYLLVNPGVHVATAEVFQAPELTRDAVPATISDFVSAAVNGDAVISCAALGNAFEPVLRRREPAIEAVFVALAQIGAPRLTGSGGTCFVEFAERGSAQAALASLPQDLNAWVAQGAACSPMLRALQIQGRRQEAQGTRF